MQKDLKIQHHGRAMDATIFLPNKSQCPIVIFCHGFNGYKDDFREIAEHLLIHEIGSLMITFCGSGARDKSGFATTNMTLFTEREDLFAAMDYAKSLPQFNGKLFLFGGSQGGMICTLAAQARPDDICAMALLFPALCIADNWNSRFPQNDDIPDEIKLWDVRLGRQFVETLRGLDIYADMGNFKSPVLIMHGSDDEVVPISYSERAAKIFPHAELITYNGEGHGFRKDAMRDVTHRLLTLIQQNS